ncbi:MAG: succinate dehydrogenase cytochrome b subunit [Muribaculaceae bacterium]|nr:succinate dehydrogenase cytochrome b subunit [Muribaculaceae bacterium]MDE6534033.1 succinate dehydrogenase cytochrome b subunit [Muribaculaceae bacterium]
MWLSCSSVGRKFVMALTGACLVLFVTFHCLMNAIAICWPAAYNSICEFLGANWYALIASAGLALLFIIHIIYAVMLTLQNRKARGNDRYAITKRPKTVEWSSQNMLVLGIVILAFLVVHLIQFWAKMQLQEIRGAEGMLPPAAGTLFLQEAFSCVWTPIVYIIGFVALWFHFNHGFWSMFQSIGWDNQVWIARLKKVACWWSTIVVLLFIAQAIVFTVKANDDYYKNNEDLRIQYLEMVGAMCEKDFGPDAAQIVSQINSMPYEVAAQQIPQALEQMNSQKSIPGFDQQMEANPQMKKSFETQLKLFESYKVLFDYLNSDNKDNAEDAAQAAPEANPQPEN